MKTFAPKFLMYILLTVISLSTSLQKSFGQYFQYNYGNPHDDTFSRIIENTVSGGYYVIGAEQSTPGGLRHATVLTVLSNGSVGSSYTLNMASQWNDAILTPAGELLVVGHTLPLNSTNQSLIGRFNTSGPVTVNSYDNPGQETLTRIVLNPAPFNIALPYYILGKQTFNAATADDDVIVITMDAIATTFTKTVISSGDDDEFANDLDVMANGDLIVAGHRGNDAVILYLDNQANPHNGLTPAGELITYTAVFDHNGDVYATANSLTTSHTYIMKYQGGFFPVWERRSPDLTSIDEIWIDPGSSDLIVTGSGVYNSLNRPVVLRYFEGPNNIFISWLKFLDNGEPSYEDCSVTLLSTNDIAYVDARQPVTNGFGFLDGFISIMDLEMDTSCMTWVDYADSAGVTFLYNGPQLPVASPDALPAATPTAWTQTSWGYADACAFVDSCVANFDFMADPCGFAQFADGSGATGSIVQWCWDFDNDLSTCESTQVNPTWQFAAPPCQTFQACLIITTDTGCSDTICKPVFVFDNVPPVIVCPQDVTLACDDDLTPATAGIASAFDNCPDPPSIIYIDQVFGTLPCNGFVERTWTASDDCGNISSCIQIITVSDNIPPVITFCPPDMAFTFSGVSSPCSQFIPIPLPVAIDQCDPNITWTNDYNSSPDASDFYPNGNTTITFTATDACGNTTTCLTTIIINCIPDSCICLNMASVEFYWNNGLAGWEIGLPCDTGAVTTALPCIPSGDSYSFKGEYFCSDSCMTSVDYDILALPSNTSVQSGTLQTTSLGNNLHSYDLLFGFNPTPGTYQLQVSAHCGNDSCVCMVNFIIPECDTCFCGDFGVLMADWEGVYTDVAGCGDTINVPNGLSVTIDASFLCQGNECDTVSIIEWSLTNPIGSMFSGNVLATPGYAITISSSMFNIAGTYALNLETFCGPDTCICTIYFNGTNCGSIIDLEEQVEQAISIVTGIEDCSADFTIGALGEHIFIEFIDWGDGSVSTGPFTGETSVVHEYAESGDYEIRFLAVELDSTGAPCQARVFSQIITPDCIFISCCLGPTNLLFGPTISGLIQVGCGDTAYIHCVPGASYSLTGFFDCNPSTCPSVPMLDWILFDPAGNQISGSSIVTNPFFGITLPSTHFYQFGTYTLQLEGMCAGGSCGFCQIHIFVDIPCPNPCPCDPLDLQQDVAKGFLQFASINSSCKRCFKPWALGPCDTVEWHVGAFPNPNPVTTVGNQTFCHTFTASGTYFVTMVVRRKSGVNMLCEIEMFQKQVSVNCGLTPTVCKARIANSGFDSLSVPGILGIDGETQGWTSVTGMPRVVESTTNPDEDGWLLSLSGNADDQDAVTILEPVCLEKNNLTLTLGLQSLTLHPGEEIVVSLVRGDVIPPDECIEPSLCREVARIDIPSEDWFEVEIEHDLSDMMEDDNCSSCGSVLVRPVISLRNNLSNVQGPASRSQVLLDYFCLENELCVSSVSVTEDPELRIYPNPNSGEFIVDISRVTGMASSIQISDLNGRVIWETEVQPGRHLQSISLEALTNGMYFIRILSEDQPMTTGKFVKQ